MPLVTSAVNAKILLNGVLRNRPNRQYSHNSYRAKTVRYTVRGIARGKTVFVIYCIKPFLSYGKLSDLENEWSLVCVLASNYITVHFI